MNVRIILTIVAIAVLIGLAGWLVGVRTKNISLPTGPLPSLTESASAPPAAEPETSALPVLADHMPEFAGISQWLNSPPLKQSDLRGKVVLIDFWTYSCINCIRTLPYVTSWQQKYGGKDFTVIGVHTPEFAFEKVPANVKEAIQRFKITYPVPLDNDYGTWNAYNNEYWPAEYLFDAKGRLRHTHFGEGQYDETERDIQALLKEAGENANAAVTETPSQVDFSQIGSLETYLGYEKASYLGSPERVKADAVQTYSVAPEPKLNLFYLGGKWTMEKERATAAEAGAKIVYRYSASNAELVMGPPDGKTGRVEALLDGKPVPAEARGADIKADPDGTTFIQIDAQRLYDIIRTPGKYGEHVLELHFQTPGTAGYAFTFG